MEFSSSGLALMLLLLAYSEQPCCGNETNGREAQKEVVRDPNMAATSSWSRYVCVKLSGIGSIWINGTAKRHPRPCNNGAKIKVPFIH